MSGSLGSTARHRAPRSSKVSFTLPFSTIATALAAAAYMRNIHKLPFVLPHRVGQQAPPRPCLPLLLIEVYAIQPVYPTRASGWPTPSQLIRPQPLMEKSVPMSQNHRSPRSLPCWRHFSTRISSFPDWGLAGHRG